MNSAGSSAVSIVSAPKARTRTPRDTCLTAANQAKPFRSSIGPLAQIFSVRVPIALRAAGGGRDEDSAQRIRDRQRLPDQSPARVAEGGDIAPRSSGTLGARRNCCYRSGRHQRSRDEHSEPGRVSYAAGFNVFRIIGSSRLAGGATRRRSPVQQPKLESRRPKASSTTKLTVGGPSLETQ